MAAVAKAWHLRPGDPDVAARLAKDAGISAVTAQLLLQRGVFTAAQAKSFLDAPLLGLHDPELLPGLSDAADRIISAVREKRRICIYGDYDVDGTTGTAILLGLLKLLDANAEFYVPNRFDEGYGLNIEAVRTLAASGVAVLVTVDCGIGSLAEADEAKRVGVELIVTDHHELSANLPAAAAVVHPRLPGSQYPNAGLSGAGVAFKLAWAIAQRASGTPKVAPQFREYLLDCMALAALGLVADVMPLRDENRPFVRHGLLRLAKQPQPGLKALMEVAKCADRPLKSDDIGFRLAPRLNAAGRLECARLVVELLTTANASRAGEIAAYLESLNQKRQSIERKIVEEAREMVETNGYHNDAGIVVMSSEWHAGVVGIVAARLVDRFGRPTLVVAGKENDEPSSGSGRSVPGFALHEALRACSSELLGHGGHAAAAGFKVLPSRIDALRNLFRDYASRHFQGKPPAPRMVLDAEVPLFALTKKMLSELDHLEPFGIDNPRPKFLATGLTIEGQPKTMGETGKHLNFRVRQGTTTLRAVAFGMAERLPELLSANGACSLAFSPRLNDWNGQQSVEIEVNDLRPGSTPELV